MNKRMRAFRMLFKAATSVTCQDCGKELKGQSLPRLARRGCPDCHSKKFSYHGLPEEVAQRLNRIPS